VTDLESLDGVDHIDTVEAGRDSKAAAQCEAEQAKNGDGNFF
jgi:hypothetical protein